MIVAGPVFRYFELFDRILDRGIFALTPKVTAWRAALAARPSIRETRAVKNTLATELLELGEHRG